MLTIARTQFADQREQVLQNLSTARLSKSYTKKDYLDDLINWDSANQQFAEALKPLVYLILTETGQAAIQEVGLSPSQFDPITRALTDYFNERSLKIATDVDVETDKQLRASLSEGIRAGEGSNELRARVEAVFGNASTLRADRIARTEVSRAQGFADIEAWRQSGVVSAKEWFTAEDERVCLFCNALDHTIIPLNDNFFSKGDSQVQDGRTQHYNYDNVPSQPLHVKCRCVLLPVRT